jgi:Rrf2 family transcriptional regulator, nitric oxide-sensitive transcriptional repressor
MRPWRKRCASRNYLAAGDTVPHWPVLGSRAAVVERSSVEKENDASGWTKWVFVVPIFGTVQLLVYTDYALRVLLYVGAHEDAPVPASEIAGAYGISLDHVAKAAKALTRHGWLRATRGIGGGVQLAKPASEIRIGAVVRLFEQGRGPVECLREGGSPCKIEPACRLRRAFERAEQAFYRELDACSLADLLQNRPKLIRLLPRRAVAGT